MRRWPAVLGALLLSPPALAHGFGRLYNLPVPFWLYAWGAAAVLLVSFVIVGYFVATPAAGAKPVSHDLSDARWVVALRRARFVTVLQVLTVFALLLSIATGFFGTRDPYRNFSMTAFWVVFVLGFAYLTALIGDLYAAINPWRTLAGWLDKAWHGFSRGRRAYPRSLGDWPAVALYGVFIWFELFSLGRPSTLATMLAAYSAITLAGVWLFGAAAWFRHGEFFSLFLRLVALMAPIEYRPGQSLRWRWPFAGLLQERPERLSTVVFALFMLSSTAFDGLKVTQTWVYFFWHNEWLAQWLGKSPVYAYATLRPWYLAWDTLWLLASPFIYFGVYLSFVWLARALARSTRPLRELALDFGFTLLPIALVYNVTHYFTLVLTQGVKIVSLVSDPFGWGWNMFGTLTLWRAPILPDLAIVWHAQVALILLGHVVSVVVAHAVALRVFANRREAVLSQVPMLCLMVLFTVAGLWILAQPLTAMQIR